MSVFVRFKQEPFSRRSPERENNQSLLLIWNYLIDNISQPNKFMEAMKGRFYLIHDNVQYANNKLRPFTIALIDLDVFLKSTNSFVSHFSPIIELTFWCQSKILKSQEP